MRGSVSGGFRAHFLFWFKTMSNQSVGEQIQAIAARVAAERNLEFVHCEVVGSKRNPVVRVFINKPDGVTHEDCVAVSRQMEAILDAEDFIGSAYLLEVSSPGLERGLYSLQDFEKFTGQMARVKTNVPIDGQKNFSGRIIAVESGEIVFDDKTRGEARFPYTAVAKANLEIDLEEELKKSGK
jgi:ribosome maturation factor RimP